MLRRVAEFASVPYLLPLVVAMLVVGLGDAVTGPYFALFATDRVHLTPFALGTILTARACSGIVISTLMGRWFDRSPGPAPLLLALAMGVAGFLLLTVTRNFMGLLLIACLPLGTATAAFPQLFAIAKMLLDRVDAATAERGIALLRAIWSVAWTAGPAVGALVVTRFDFPGLFVASALLEAAAGAILVTARLPRFEAKARVGAESPAPVQSVRSAAPAALSLTLFHMAMFMGSIALPIVVTHDLGGSKGDVGMMFSLCAFLEVFVMTRFVLRPVRPGGRGWIAAGFVAFALYFVLLATLRSVDVMIGAQALRAIAIGLVGCLGIGYVQALLLGRVGTAATLFANTGSAGSLMAGLTAGLWAQQFGFASLFGVCAALSMIGLAVLRLQKPVRVRPAAQASVLAAD